MKKLTKILWLLAITLLSNPVLGQQRQVDVAGAAQVQMLLSDEQVRLVHSQPWYAAGERLWYKAFVNRNSSNPPSKALYVTLLDARGNTIINQRLVVEEGMANSDIELPKELPSGNYTLVAATNWMKNFSEKQQYREQLLIVNPREVMALRNIKANHKPLHVQFFPESNSLLAGKTSRVTVLVTNAAGIGIAAQGTVTDSTGRAVASFRSDDTGVGAFELKADLEQAYVAQVQAEGYQTLRVALPKAKQNGLALSVTEKSNTGIKVDVRSTMPWAYTLLAESGGKVYFTHSAKGTGEVTVPWQEKPGEAVRLMLLNPGGLVEAEQSVMYPGIAPALQVSTDRRQYGTRQQVSVTLQGIPQAVTAAVAVAAQQADSHRPLAGNPVTGGNAGEGSQFLAHTADEGLWQDILQGKKEGSHAREPIVEPISRAGIARPFISSTFVTRTDTAFVQALPPSVVAYAQKIHTLAHINEIYGLTEPHAPAILPRLPADRVYKLDDYIAFNNVEEAIKEVTTNIRMRKKKGRQTVRLLYVAPGTKRMMKQEPLYLLDGVIVDGMEEMLALDLNDIASIEIAWSEEKLYAGNLGQMVDNGMFAIYTKSGEAREQLKEKGLPMLYEQYNLPQNFISLSGIPGEGGPSTPDLKQLIFWEPTLHLGPDGKAKFTFYTSDETGTFRVKVLGQTAEGIPVSGEAEFEVKLVN
ncbi:hypothetical protein [Pontibacter aquaedesilientis]|nr:hypothetical protein [Pontibacter aquaedesilientis]